MNEHTESVVLVTGAGQGVGREICLAFGRAGARAIVVNDVRPERAEAVAGEVKEAGTEAVALAGDVTRYEAVQELVAEAARRVGPISVLVNNAGSSGADPSSIENGNFWDVSPENWAPFVDVNLYGPMHCTRAVLPAMIERGGGRIITIISEAARVGEVGLEAYSAAKAGAAGFTRAIARAVGRHGVTANNVAIAATRTPTTRGVLDDAATVAKMMSRYVIRRPGEPADVAPVVLLLASPSASYITGQTYPVNGGFSFNL